MSIRVWYTGDHNYDVRDFDEVWPEHKDAVACTRRSVGRRCG